jgi:hypothetical protein
MSVKVSTRRLKHGREDDINLLAPEFGIQILAHSVCKMRIIQEPKKVAL